MAATPAAPMPIAADATAAARVGVSAACPAAAAGAGRQPAGAAGSTAGARGGVVAAGGRAATSANETRAYSPAATFTVLTAGRWPAALTSISTGPTLTATGFRQRHRADALSVDGDDRSRPAAR